MSKPTPAPRPVSQNKVKAVRQVTPASAQGTDPKISGGIENVMSVTPAQQTKRMSRGKSTIQETQLNQQVSEVALSTPRETSSLQKQVDPKESGNTTKLTQKTTNKRQSSSKPRETAPVKRRKTSQPAPPEIRWEGATPAEVNLVEEIGRNFISLMKRNEGIFELVPRLDLEYAEYVEKFVPGAEPRVDGKLLMHVLDDLEARRELVRVMLSTETPIGTRQYKSLLILPDIDPTANPKIKELREELQQEVGSCKFSAILGTVPAESEPSEPALATLEIVQNLSKPGRIPPVLHSAQTVNIDTTAPIATSVVPVAKPVEPVAIPAQLTTLGHHARTPISVRRNPLSVKEIRNRGGGRNSSRGSSLKSYFSPSISGPFGSFSGEVVNTESDGANEEG